MSAPLPGHRQPFVLHIGLGALGLWKNRRALLLQRLSARQCLHLGASVGCFASLRGRRHQPSRSPEGLLQGDIAVWSVASIDAVNGLQCSSDLSWYRILMWLVNTAFVECSGGLTTQQRRKQRICVQGSQNDSVCQQERPSCARPALDERSHRTKLCCICGPVRLLPAPHARRRQAQRPHLAGIPFS